VDVAVKVGVLVGVFVFGMGTVMVAVAVFVIVFVGVLVAVGVDVLPIVLVIVLVGVGVKVAVKVLVDVEVYVLVGPVLQVGTGVKWKFLTSEPKLFGVKFQSEIIQGPTPAVRAHAVAPTMPLLVKIQLKKPLSNALISPPEGGQLKSGPYSPMKTG